MARREEAGYASGYGSGACGEQRGTDGTAGNQEGTEEVGIEEEHALVRKNKSRHGNGKKRREDRERGPADGKRHDNEGQESKEENLLAKGEGGVEQSKG